MDRSVGRIQWVSWAAPLCVVCGPSCCLLLQVKLSCAGWMEVVKPSAHQHSFWLQHFLVIHLKQNVVCCSFVLLTPICIAAGIAFRQGWACATLTQPGKGEMFSCYTSWHDRGHTFVIRQQGPCQFSPSAPSLVFWMLLSCLSFTQL